MHDHPLFVEPEDDPATQRDRVAFYELALDSADSLIWLWDIATDRLGWAGRSSEFMFGVPEHRSVLTGMEFLELVYVEDRRTMTKKMARLMAEGGEFTNLYRALTEDGEVRWHAVRGGTIADEQGRVVRVYGVVQDLTDRVRAEEALRESEQRFKTVLAGAPLAIVGFGTDGKVTLAQGSALEALRFDVGALVGADIRALLVDHPEAVTAVDEVLRGGIVEIRVQIAEIVFDVSYRPLTGPADDVIGAVLVATDVTEKVQAQAQLERLALHDPLTDLANRVLFQSRLEHHLARSARRRTSTAVLFLDLDRFKEINDGHGHHVGDALLRAMADRLRSSVRPEDTVARFGGDEFLVLIEVTSGREVEAVAQRVIATLGRPMTLGSLALQVGVSVGAAVVGPTAEGDVVEVATSLVRRADSAMYRAKQAGRGRYVLADPTGC